MEERRQEYIDLTIAQAEIKKDIFYIKENIANINDCLRTCKMGEIKTEIDALRRFMFWTIGIAGSIIAFIANIVWGFMYRR